jgi:hypothetical protein
MTAIDHLHQCLDAAASTHNGTCIAKEDANASGTRQRRISRRDSDNRRRRPPPLGLLFTVMLLLTACSSNLARGVDALSVQSTKSPISPIAPSSRRMRDTWNTILLPLDIKANAGQRALSSSSTPSRRSALASLFGITTTTTAAAVLVGTTASASAADDTAMINVDPAKILLRGTVTLRSDVALNPGMLSSTSTMAAAVYITARPDRPDNVPKAILDGSRGKAPPVLVVRISLSSLGGISQVFPLEFTLTAADVTVEGQGQQQEVNSDEYWWSRDNLIVSARLDSDGVAATRDPNDLVGRSTVKRNRKRNDVVDVDVVVVELQGRGVGGKFVTGKAVKK